MSLRGVNLFFVLGLGFLLSCSYPLEKKFVNPIQPPQKISVVVEVTAPNFKTPYYLDWNTTFTLKFDNINKPIKSFAITLDGNSVTGTLADNQLQFNLNPGTVGDGTHLVKVQVYADSQSGSLADQLGVENYLIEKDFDIVVQSNLPSLSVPINATLNNGYLKLDWDLNSNHNFMYRVVRYTTDHGLQTFLGSANLTGSGKMSFYDSGYVGGHTQYAINVSNFANSSNIPQVDVNLGTRFSLQQDSHHAYKLVWKPIYYDANLTIVGPLGGKSISYSVGTVDLDTLFLGDVKNYRVEVNRNNYLTQKFDSAFALTTSANLPAFADVKVLPVQSKFIIYGPLVYRPADGATDIFRYSLSDFSKESALTSYLNTNYYYKFNDVSVSADGGRSVIAMSYNGTLSSPLKLNPLNFSVYSDYLDQLTQPDGSYSLIRPNKLSTLANNGFLGLSFYNSGSQRAAIFDMSLTADPNSIFDQVVWQEANNTDVPVLSDDGRFFCVNTIDQTAGRVFQNISGTWTQIGMVPLGQKYFRNNSTTELIVVGNTLQVFDVGTAVGAGAYFSPLRSFTYPHAATKVGYDNATQKIFVETISSAYYSTIRTYDVAGFAFKDKVTAYVAPTTFPVNHIFANNYHFVSSGYVEKIP